MTKSVLVPLDGSVAAERALPTGRWLSRTLGVELHLVSTTVGPRTLDQQEYLERVGDDLDDVRVVPHVVGHRFPGPGILELAETIPEAAICMTTRGASGWAVSALGSVTDDVLRHSTEPVVLVGHASAADESPRQGGLVVGIDGSNGSLAVLSVIADWSARLHRPVEVVATAQTGVGAGDARSDDARQRVAIAVDRLEAMGIEATPHVLFGVSPSDLVVEFATATTASLVAVGTHGVGGPSLRALGHVAAAIVRESPCPVLVRRMFS